jgi:hypothetical protein
MSTTKGFRPDELPAAREEEGTPSAVETVIDEGALTMAHVAVEDMLIELRDARIGVIGPANGFVVKEKDGTPSGIMRLGTRAGLRVAIKAYLSATGGHRDTLPASDRAEYPLTVAQAEDLAVRIVAAIDALDADERRYADVRHYWHYAADRERVASDLAGLRLHSGTGDRHDCNACWSEREFCGDAHRYSDGLLRTAALYELQP